MVCSVAEQVVTFLDRVAKTLNSGGNGNATCTTPDAKQRSNSARCRYIYNKRRVTFSEFVVDASKIVARTIILLLNVGCHAIFSRADDNSQYFDCYIKERAVKFYSNLSPLLSDLNKFNCTMG
jgi:hypothetical protein